MKPLISRTADGFYRLPAFIDAHVHVESSHLTPARFGRLIASQGTLAAICDPHEIANVTGEAGLEFMLADAKGSPADLRFTLPSCVHATPFETSGAALTAADTARLFAAHPELVALGEMMNVPGVLSGDSEVLGKIAAAKAAGKPVDGHFPGGSGEALRRYAAAGVSSDHETLTPGEAREKVAAGLTVFIREGSAAKNLEALLPAVDDTNWERFCFCTDDCSAHDLIVSGGIVNCIRKAVALGMDPERAVALATVNPARHYGLTPSDRDCVIVKDLVGFEIVRVMKDGRPLVTEDVTPDESEDPNTVHLPDLSGHAFRAPDPTDGAFDVIGVNDGSLVTDHLRRTPSEIDGLALLTVIERHGKNGNVASAWTARTGLRRGASRETRRRTMRDAQWASDRRPAPARRRTHEPTFPAGSFGEASRASGRRPANGLHADRSLRDPFLPRPSGHPRPQADRSRTFPRLTEPYFRTKLVWTGASFSGKPNFSLPRAMDFMRKVMFFASVRIVWSPSASSAASPGAHPWTLFQYWLEAIGIPEIVKYLLRTSNVAEQPPRRATATDAPTFMRLSNLAEKKSRSRNETSVPFGEA